MGGGHSFHIFLRVFFFRQKKFEADRERRKALGRVRGHAPRKNFENLHAIMAILVLFE